MTMTSIFLLTNGNSIWIWVFAILALVGALILFFKDKIMMQEEVIVDEESNAVLQHIAEYRTYMINQWVCLLAFWVGIKTEDAQTKMTCPGYNQNTLYFFHQNLEIYTFFDWNAEVMTVKTSVFQEDRGYTTHEKPFTLSGKDLKTKELFEFIQRAKNEHYNLYDLTADDVVAVTRELKMLSKPFESDEAAKNHLFDHAADLMITMRDKKLRNNRRLFKVYMGLIFWLWSVYGEEFLTYLNMTEEEFMGVAKENTNEGTNE